jgi:drug/metabolite transporter (DMT)-like permease
MNVFLLALVSILISVAAQFSLKTGMSVIRAAPVPVVSVNVNSLLLFLTNKWLIGGFLLYGLGALVWLSVLSKWEVSKAYPMVGLGFVFTTIIGFALGEEVTLLRAAGVSLIVAGVYVVAIS